MANWKEIRQMVEAIQAQSLQTQAHCKAILDVCNAEEARTNLITARETLERIVPTHLKEEATTDTPAGQAGPVFRRVTELLKPRVRL